MCILKKVFSYQICATFALYRMRGASLDFRLLNFFFFSYCFCIVSLRLSVSTSRFICIHITHFAAVNNIFVYTEKIRGYAEMFAARKFIRTDFLRGNGSHIHIFVAIVHLHEMIIKSIQ